MVDQVDDIARQARQGSVSAIIQVLNEKLADSGVRTRAIFAKGVLQLLCEAAKPEQLEQSTLVDQVRQILESIRPRSIHRININSRIVREQQLLWLDEVNRDPEHQLLWSQEIKLTRMNPVQRLLEDWFSDKPDYLKSLPKAGRDSRETRQFWRGIIGGVSLSLLLLLLGWVVSDWLGLEPAARFKGLLAPTSEATPTPAPPSPANVPPRQDPFVQAVRLAEQAVADGQKARSPADWLDLATRWQRASDLMAQVPPADRRFTTAQSRIQVYGANSRAALTQAAKPRPAVSPPAGTPAGTVVPSPRPAATPVRPPQQN